MVIGGEKLRARGERVFAEGIIANHTLEPLYLVVLDCVGGLLSRPAAGTGPGPWSKGGNETGRIRRVRPAVLAGGAPAGAGCQTLASV
jgi:hypothetical protein